MIDNISRGNNWFNQSLFAELQTIKTFSAEVNVEVIEEEPTRKLSKLTLLTDEMQKGAFSLEFFLSEVDKEW